MTVYFSISTVYLPSELYTFKDRLLLGTVTFPSDLCFRLTMVYNPQQG